MTTMEIILVTLVAAICGMGSVLDERQTHRPLVACTLIGLVLGDLVAAAGQVLTIFVRTLTIFLQHKADDFAAKANFRGIEFCHFSGLALQALRVAIPTFFVALVAGTDTVTEALNAIPEVVTRGLQIAGGFIVVVGYAMVINMMRAGALMPFFFLGFVIASFTNYNLVGLGILGTCLAMIYIQLNPRFHQSTAPQAVAKRELADDELEGL